MTAGPGRPRKDFCKRGHDLSRWRSKHTTCVLCKSVTRRLRYREDPEFRKRAVRYTQDWRKRMKETENGSG